MSICSLPEFTDGALKPCQKTASRRPCSPLIFRGSFLSERTAMPECVDALKIDTLRTGGEYDGGQTFDATPFGLTVQSIIAFVSFRIHIRR